MSEIQTHNPAALGLVWSGQLQALANADYKWGRLTDPRFRVKGWVSLVPKCRVRWLPSPLGLIVTAHQPSSSHKPLL